MAGKSQIIELVEGLDSGMRRILAAYDQSVFEITQSFIVVAFPYAEDFARSSSDDETGLNQNLKQDGENETRLNQEWNDVLSNAEMKKVRSIENTSAVTYRLCSFATNKNEGQKEEAGI